MHEKLCSIYIVYWKFGHPPADRRSREARLQNKQIIEPSHDPNKQNPFSLIRLFAVPSVGN